MYLHHPHCIRTGSICILFFASHLSIQSSLARPNWVSRADFLRLLCLQETFRFRLISIQLLRLEGREDARVVSQLPCTEKQQNESIRSWDLTSWSHPCLSENWVRSGQHPQKMLGIYHSVFFFMHNESLFGIRSSFFFFGFSDHGGRMWSNGVVFFSGLPSCCTNEIQKVGVMWHNHRSSLAVTIATCPGLTWWSWT